MRHGIAIQQVITPSALRLGLLIAAPLAEYVFNPMLDYNGALAGIAWRILGVEPDRGTSLMFISAGVFNTLALVASALYARIWHVDDERPNGAIAR